LGFLNREVNSKKKTQKLGVDKKKTTKKSVQMKEKKCTKGGLCRNTLLTIFEELTQQREQKQKKPAENATKGPR